MNLYPLGPYPRLQPEFAEELRDFDAPEHRQYVTEQEYEQIRLHGAAVLTAAVNGQQFAGVLMTNLTNVRTKPAVRFEVTAPQPAPQRQRGRWGNGRSHERPVGRMTTEIHYDANADTLRLSHERVRRDPVDGIVVKKYDCIAADGTVRLAGAMILINEGLAGAHPSILESEPFSVDEWNTHLDSIQSLAIQHPAS